MIRILDMVLCLALLVAICALSARRWAWLEPLDRWAIAAGCLVLVGLLWGFWEFYRVGAPITGRVYWFGGTLSMLLVLVLWPRKRKAPRHGHHR